MKDKSCLKEFLQYTALNVLGMLGLSCYILADTFFVSKGLGADGLTALNLAIPIYSFVHGSGLMLGVGGSAKYAILRGQQSSKDANLIFTNTLYLTLIMAALFVLIGLFGSEKITWFLGADSSVFGMTNTYLKVILLFAPAFMLNDVFLCFVRNDGNPRLAMMAMLAGSFSNILLDYIFIFPCNMGILGAVCATGFAPVISMAVLTGHLKKKDHFARVKCRVQYDLAGKIVALGIPSLITEVASGIVMIVFNFLILDIQGNVGVAAYGVVANLALVVVAIHTGVAQGMQPLISRAFGVKDFKSIRKFLKYAMWTMTVISVLIYAGLFIWAEPIASVFNSEGNLQLQSMAVIGLKLYFTAVWFIGFNVVLAMYFIATENPVPAQVISVLRGIVLVIPVAFVMAYMWEITGVWLTMVVTEGIVCLIGIIILIRRTCNIDVRSLIR